jgi:hypothetical protein
MLGNDTEEAMQSEENDYRGSHAGKIETWANLREIPLRVMPLKPLLQAPWVLYIKDLQSCSC